MYSKYEHESRRAREMAARIAEWFLDRYDEWRDAPLGWKLSLAFLTLGLIGRIALLVLLITGAGK